MFKNSGNSLLQANSIALINYIFHLKPSHLSASDLVGQMQRITSEH